MHFSLSLSMYVSLFVDAVSQQCHNISHQHQIVLNCMLLQNLAGPCIILRVCGVMHTKVLCDIAKYCACVVIPCTLVTSGLITSPFNALQWVSVSRWG